MLISGPCGIESREQAFKIAEFVKSCGATHFRGGLWKGQNRPIVNGKSEYLGIGGNGLEILKEIQDKLDLPCVCDFQSLDQLMWLLNFGIKHPMIGARNADNLDLLREAGKMMEGGDGIRFLKRGPSQTIQEFLGAAEHLGGPNKVILCERGTVHYDRHDYTRYRLDMVGVAEIKHYHPEYKIIVDPSHGSGDRNLVESLCGMSLSIADGIMVEVHYDPDSSPTDAPQTIDFETFKRVANEYENFGRLRNK